MKIVIDIPTDLENLSVKDLIIADIQLKLICKELSNYDYDMSYLPEKSKEIDDELVKRLRAARRKRLVEIENQIEASLPASEKLAKLREEAAVLKSKLGQ